MGRPQRSMLNRVRVRVPMRLPSHLLLPPRPQLLPPRHLLLPPRPQLLPPKLLLLPPRHLLTPTYPLSVLPSQLPLNQPVNLPPQALPKALPLPQKKRPMLLPKPKSPKLLLSLPLLLYRPPVRLSTGHQPPPESQWQGMMTKIHQLLIPFYLFAEPSLDLATDGCQTTKVPHQ